MCVCVKFNKCKMRVPWVILLTSLLTVSSWCDHGTIIESNNECLCNLEGENSCVGSGCISGYGSSFYPKSCKSCRCKTSSSSDKKIPTREVEGNIAELEKYMNWRDELARAKVTDPNKRKQFIVVASSIAIFSVLSFFVCCLTMGGTCSIYIVAALRKLYRTNLFFLTRSMGCVFFFSKDICATLPSLLDIQRLS